MRKVNALPDCKGVFVAKMLIEAHRFQTAFAYLLFFAHTQKVPIEAEVAF